MNKVSKLGLVMLGVGLLLSFKVSADDAIEIRRLDSEWIAKINYAQNTTLQIRIPVQSGADREFANDFLSGFTGKQMIDEVAHPLTYTGKMLPSGEVIRVIQNQRITSRDIVARLCSKSTPECTQFFNLDHLKLIQVGKLE